MADLSVHLKAGSDAHPNAENVDSEDPYAWMKFGLTPDLKAILESSHTNPGLRPEESGDVDSDPGAFDEIDLQYPSQTTPNPESEMYGTVDPGTDAFDEMGPQYPLLTTASARSPSSLVHNSLLTSSGDSDDSDSNAVDEAVPYVPLEASPSAFLPGALFRFASEDHYPAPSPAPSFGSHNALQLDLGLGTPAFAQSASVTVPQVITPALPRPSRARTTNVTLPEVTEEDMGPDSDNDASDDEYIPSMRRTTRKHRRVARSSSNASHVTAKRPRPVLPPRNVQLPLPLSSPLSSPGDTFSSIHL
ncbi:hypothetical protein EWM64_g2879 [Hericium alpestre]|uniref:Uncharacterized protein n=1 Tax=Hericium alpestre TaxID=135208 RepID=A0A4Z0A275_9AGAM|nr:hypothetical protein EWM64_g2879 [Hericium alpestre]